MGAALPLGDPAPSDGALPDDIRIDRDVDFGAYLHVPFCRVRCGYCDFNTYTATELRGARQDEYADTLLREIDLSAGVLAARGPLRAARTVFFGGGTPTLLPAGDLARMLDGVRGAFGLADDAEVTVEANPDTVTEEVVDELAAAGVTRMSIGMAVGGAPRPRGTRSQSHAGERRRRRAGGTLARPRRQRRPHLRGAGERIDDWRASARGGDRAGARPHLGVRAHHRGGHEAAPPDRARGGPGARRRPPGRHVRAGRREAPRRRVRLVRGVELGDGFDPSLAS